MKVCKTCGVIATGNTECGACESSFLENKVQTPAVQDGLYFCRVKANIRCGGCSAKVPVNALEAAVRCESCGETTAIPKKDWNTFLTMAQNVSDLCGQNALEKDDPLWKGFDEKQEKRIFLKIGRMSSTVALSNKALLANSVAYEVDLSPGHPVCDTCHEPLTIQRQGQDVFSQCQGCQWAARYQEHRGFAKKVVACMASSNRADVAPVKTEGDVAIALLCPQCSGSLSDVKLGEFCQCPYCSTTCIVPDSVLSSVTGTKTQSKPFWLVFADDSRIRRHLKEKQRRRAKGKQQRQEAKAQKALVRVQAQELALQKKKKLLLLAAVAGAAVVVVAVFALLLGL